MLDEGDLRTRLRNDLNATLEVDTYYPASPELPAVVVFAKPATSTPHQHVVVRDWRHDTNVLFVEGAEYLHRSLQAGRLLEPTAEELLYPCNSGFAYVTGRAMVNFSVTTALVNNVFAFLELLSHESGHHWSLRMTRKEFEYVRNTDHERARLLESSTYFVLIDPKQESAEVHQNIPRSVRTAQKQLWLSRKRVRVAYFCSPDNQERKHAERQFLLTVPDLTSLTQQLHRRKAQMQK